MPRKRNKSSLNTNEEKRIKTEGFLKGVLVTVIGGLILYFLIQYFFVNPDIVINIDRADDINVYCDNTYGYQIEYTVANKGEPSGFLSYYYVRLNQINNTCQENMYFFDNAKAMCHLEYIDENQEQFCKSKIPPLAKGDHKVIRYYFSSEYYDFRDAMRKSNITSKCEITEEIVICATYDEGTTCSKPRQISIEYMPCKK